MLLITDPALSLNNPNNPTHTAGVTFFGQFIDHDLTFDSDLAARRARPKPRTSPNCRTPAFDLDSVYGAGPVAHPELYDCRRTAASSESRSAGGRFEDLPRDPTDAAGDHPRPAQRREPDLAGLHAAFLLFHNRAVDFVRAGRHGRLPSVVFAARPAPHAWHYQWLVVHEFLPLLVGQAWSTTSCATAAASTAPSAAFIPVEFQAAAYRFGHSHGPARPTAPTSPATTATPFFGLIFDPAEDGPPIRPTCAAGPARPRRFVGWQTFFDFGGGCSVRPNKRIDTHISTPLFHLPLARLPGRRPLHGAAATQPAAPHHLGAAVGPGGGAAPGRAGALREAT